MRDPYFRTWDAVRSPRTRRRCGQSSGSIMKRIIGIHAPGLECQDISPQKMGRNTEYDSPWSTQPASTLAGSCIANATKSQGEFIIVNYNGHVTCFADNWFWQLNSLSESRLVAGLLVHKAFSLMVPWSWILSTMPGLYCEYYRTITQSLVFRTFSPRSIAIRCRYVTYARGSKAQ